MNLGISNRPFASMIDRFRRVAQSIEILRLPAIVVGLTCFASIVVLLLTSDSRESDRLLMPSFIGLLWAMSIYSFIESFRSVPEKSDAKQGLFRDLKGSIKRAWYWVKGLVFLTATAVALLLTSRMVAIWLDEYAG